MFLSAAHRSKMAVPLPRPFVRTGHGSGSWLRAPLVAFMALKVILVRAIGKLLSCNMQMICGFHP